MPGELIGGRYRLRELVGKGGFGAVYVADQIGLDRPVALKLLHQQRMDSVSKDRFEREARLAQRLEHPNTVRLLDFGCEGCDTPYIAFELLRGKSLGAALREQGAMPARRVSRIVTQVLKSLMEAHALGIVHRDIKPANLFITEHAGEPDFCKVLDFGIAKSLESQSKVLTNAGEVVGTPAYMAPEAIAGQPVTPKSDLYSLGIVMAEMLSGARLLKGDAVEIMHQHLSSEPLRLPVAVIESPLGGIVGRATAKDPGRRYADASAMLRELEASAPTLEGGSLLATALAPEALDPAALVPTLTATAPGSIPSAPGAAAMTARSSQARPALFLAGGLVAGALVVSLLVASGVLLSSFRAELGLEESPATPAAPVATGAGPGRSATAPDAGALVKPAAGWDALGAQKALAVKRAAARAQCSKLEGARIIQLTLLFKNDGTLRAATPAVPAVLNKPSGACARDVMATTVVPAFEGKEHVIMEQVLLDSVPRKPNVDGGDNFGY